VDNVEFMLGVALLTKKAERPEAKKRFLSVIRTSPRSHWADCCRSMLKEMGEDVRE
jgi:hypothetical protein